jgi:hypothetical protein
LTNTRTIKKDNFDKITKAEEHDVLVLAYSSKIYTPEWKKSNEIAFDYDTVSMRFRSLKINSVLVGAYDTYLEGMREEIDVILL